MTGKIEKTISGAMYSAPNLEHNLRTHIPPSYYEKIEQDKQKHLC